MNTDNQVPEAVPSDHEQLEWLRTRLASGCAFQNVRGWFGHTVQRLVEETREEVQTDSAFQRGLKTRFGSIAVMGKLLLGLQRKGWEAAYYELRQALHDEFYVLTGEEVVSEKRVPMTLVMYEPQKTLALLQWLFTHPLSELNRFTRLAGPRNQGEPTEATNRLFSLFPTLGSCQKRYFNRLSEGKELYVTHREEVLRAFTIPPRAIPMGTMWDLHSAMMETMESTTRSNEGMSHPFAFLIRGWDQRQVLELYDREVQGRIATWQFHLPWIFTQIDTTRIYIGLHPEDQHADWTKIHPTYVSRGVTQGVGALVMPLGCPMSRYNEYAEGQYLTQPKPRITLKRSGDSEWPWDYKSEQKEVVS